MLQKLVLGILLILIGILVIRYVAKKYSSTNANNSSPFKGYAFGTGCIVLGITYILDGFHLW